jgi:hypothetical protein
MINYMDLICNKKCMLDSLRHGFGSDSDVV